MSRHDFPGGIYPPERKQRSLTAPLRVAPLPARVVLPLDQHVGKPALPCVAAGERVKVGTVVARKGGLVSANVHASLSGTVREVSPQSVTIVGDGDDEWQRLAPLDWRRAEPSALVSRLDDSGLAGLGGAGFPTHVKAQVSLQQPIDTLVVNATECEPYITADDMTLRHYAAQVLEGAAILATLCDASRIVVGIEDNKPEACQALQAALPQVPSPIPVTLDVIETRYPSGGERQLIKKLLGRDVPSGGLPADVGVLCHNPGTLLAAQQAICEGTPLVERIVTLTGEAIERPGNYWVRLGTPIEGLLQQAGLAPDALHHVVVGGPMMGRALASLDVPVIKTTNCLIAATHQELPPAPDASPCIRCGACETVCPVQLLPQQLHWHAQSGHDAALEKQHLFDCIECGACSFVCPSHIPLVAEYRTAKQRIRLKRIETAKAEHARHRFEFRQARLARKEAEKQARRQARLAQQRQPSSSGAEPRAAELPAVDLRSLRIAQTAARAAVKKAEKALARAVAEDPQQSQEDLEMQLTTAQENLLAADARLADARAREREQTTP